MITKKEDSQAQMEEYLHKTMIDYLKTALLCLNAADGMVGRLETSEDRIKAQRDIIGYSRVEIENLLFEHEE